MRIVMTLILSLLAPAALIVQDAGASVEHRASGVSGWSVSHAAGIGLHGSLGRFASVIVCDPGSLDGKEIGGDRMGIETAGAREEIALRTGLQGGFPNPFNPATTIEYSVVSPSRVRLAVYGVQGELVRTLVEASVAAGVHRVPWDGTNGRGSAVSSGIYFVRLETDWGVFTRKLILAR